MIIFDTNVISELLLPHPDQKVIQRIDAIPFDDAWTTSVSVYELNYGLECLPNGKRKTELGSLIRVLLDKLFLDRVHFLDQNSAIASSTIAAQLKRIGKSIDIRDAMIAGITSTHNATLATRNVKHFSDTGISLINPWGK